MNPVPPPSPPLDDAAVRFGRPLGGWRLKLYTIIFEADTRAGRLFDLALVWLILASVVVVVVDSFEAMHARWGTMLAALEWFFTLTFTLEYVARLACVRRPSRYARSVFGIVDVIAVLPTWLALFVPGRRRGQPRCDTMQLRRVEPRSGPAVRGHRCRAD